MAVANTTAFFNATTYAICSATGAAYSSVHIDSVTAVGRRRELLQSGGVVIKYTISVVNGNVATMTTKINTAVSNGVFTETLRNNGFSSAVVDTPPAVVNFSPSSSPTQSPTIFLITAASAYSSNIPIETITIICTVTAIGSLMAILLLIYRRRILRVMKSVSKNKVVATCQDDEVMENGVAKI